MAGQTKNKETDKAKNADSVKDDTLQNAEETDRTLTDDAPRTEEELEEAKKSDEKNDTSPKKTEVQEIEPIAYAVKLRSIHPQAGYGRAGFRFIKTEETVIKVTEIDSDKVILLAEDPWLELVPVCEE